MIYFIHGFKEDPTEIAKKLGAIHVNVDWTKPLSEAVFPVEKTDIIVGFSMGAIIAYMVAKRYSCKAVLCSMTKPKAYAKDVWIDESMKDMSEENAENQVEELFELDIDISTVDCVCMFGEKEDKDKIVHNSQSTVIPNVGHELSADYISVIKKEIDFFRTHMRSYKN